MASPDEPTTKRTRTGRHSDPTPESDEPAVKPGGSTIPATPMPKTDDVQQVRKAQFREVCGSCEELFLERNEQYGDAITRTGVLGAAVEIAGISARIEHIVLRSDDAGRSQQGTLTDLIKDLHNYANIAGIMLMEDNWKGK